jgi:hypothetical protein
MDQHEFEVVERSLTSTLVRWSAASVIGGTTLALVGQRAKRDQLSKFGRQNAAWGIVDAVIAGAGVMARRRRGSLAHDEVTDKVRSLRRLLLINAAADIAYIAGGLAIAAKGRNGGITLRMGAGDGVGIVVQGAFLLALDLSHARRL